MDHLKLTVDKLSIEEITELVTDDSCGAISLFVGTTRDNFEGKKVLKLEYEAYEPMALKMMQAICNEVRQKWPAVHRVAIYHRLGEVPCREASVVIAVSSPHRAASLAAVAHCIDSLKANVPIWKKEIYDQHAPVWKENVECEQKSLQEVSIDKSQVQINVSNAEIRQRIINFMEKKREQVNLCNIHDFIPKENETDDTDETSARVRTRFVRRSDSKGHLKVRRVNNEWGPQTVRQFPPPSLPPAHGYPSLPPSIAERVLNVENYLNIGTGPVPKDIYQRLKEMEDKIAYLQSVSPEYAMFWKRNDEPKQDPTVDYTFSAEDIARKIERLERDLNQTHKTEPSSDY